MLCCTMSRSAVRPDSTSATGLFEEEEKSAKKIISFITANHKVALKKVLKTYIVYKRPSRFDEKLMNHLACSVPRTLTPELSMVLITLLMKALMTMTMMTMMIMMIMMTMMMMIMRISLLLLSPDMLKLRFKCALSICQK